MRNVILTLVILIVLSIFSSHASAQTAEIAIVNSETGSNEFTFPPETPVNSTFLANITVSNVDFLATWQINITWDPELLNISSAEDMILPPDNIFGEYTDPVGLTITSSSVFWVVGIKLEAPFEYVNVTQGTLCQINFTIIKNDTELPLSCNIHFVVAGEHPFYTKLIDLEGELIEYTPIDSSYTIIPELNNILMVSILLMSTAIAVIFSRKKLLKKHLIQKV